MEKLSKMFALTNLRWERETMGARERTQLHALRTGHYLQRAK